MNFEKKYLKYKSKYLLLKQNGGKFLTLERDQNFIDSRFNKIPNKGTQNCGVYILKKNPNQILICNLNQIPEDKLKFITENPDVYPTLYNEYIIKNQVNLENKYYYLWKKMKGDLRDLFTEIIPKKYLEKNYNFFYLKYNNNPNNIYLVDDYMKKLFIENKNYKQIDTNIEELSGYSGYYHCFCEEQDYSIIIEKIKCIEESKSNVSNSNFYAIINEIEKNIEIIIKELSKKMLTILDNGFVNTDAKYDNIVYDTNEDGSYKFYFIDPESTLTNANRYFNEGEKKLIRNIKNNFSFLKLNDMKPNIYENFASKMFNLIDLSNIPRSTENEKINFLFFKDKKITQVRVAQESFCPKENNIFPLEINNKEELKIFLDKKISV